MLVRAEAPFAPMLTRNEMISILSASVAGSCCGEVNEMLAWIERRAPTDMGAPVPVERPSKWLCLRELFLT